MIALQVSMTTCRGLSPHWASGMPICWWKNIAEKEQLDKALEAENKKFEAEQKAEISRKLAEEEARLEAELVAEQEKLLKA